MAVFLHTALVTSDLVNNQEAVAVVQDPDGPRLFKRPRLKRQAPSLIVPITRSVRLRLNMKQYEPG
jgi:hypothetical protein